ncbi:MAG: UDP-N-acetylglucosamine--N-acetylmuramyl-(pentapeptide) pyrophosphoryl-undecaprenol N-acetylglucosamine transferase [Alphaproteobacteria bacterium]
MSKGTVLMVAGASGGHVFPALAVADELKAQGYTCVFVLGGGKFGHLITARGYALEYLPAAAFANRGPIALMKAGFMLVRGLLRARELVAQYKPVAAFGTGGYATVAMMAAAKMAGVPTIIHNADTILGRANKLLARWVDKVLVTFPETYVPAVVEAKTVVVGTPLRHEVLEARTLVRVEDGVFRLLVLGGSQGSAVLGAVVPAMVRQLSLKERESMAVVHQARAQDVEMLEAQYAGIGLRSVEVKAFFDDLPARTVACNLIVARAGMNTLLEACTLGRAAIYCPHRLADNHQLHNARVAVEAGAALLLEEPNFTPDNLRKEVRVLMMDKARVAGMETAALGLARVDAAVRGAEEIIKVVRHG